MFFDVKAGADAIEVTAIHCAAEKVETTGTLYVADSGGYEGQQSRSSSWTAVNRSVNLKEKVAIETVLDPPVRIEAGQSRGFYVHSTSHSESVAYVSGNTSTTWTGDTTAAQIIKGNYSKSSTPFSNVDSDHRQISGGIRYQLASSANVGDAALLPPDPLTLATFDHSSIVAFDAGDRVGCRLVTTKGKSITNLVYTLNGNILCSVELGKLAPQSMDGYEAVVVVGAGNQVAFVTNAPTEEVGGDELSKAELAFVHLDLCCATARAICNSMPPPNAITASPQESSSSQSQSAKWVWGKHETSSMDVRSNGRVVKKTDSSPDYSMALGSLGFTTGVHVWEMQIDGDIDGVWIGVTQEDVRLNSRITSQSQINACIWRPDGSCFRHVAGNTRGQVSGASYRCGDKLEITLNMNAATIAFKKGSNSTELNLEEVTGELFPFVCFDFTSYATILSQSSGGGGDWLGLAVSRWNGGLVAAANAASASPGAGWSQAHDEQLCKALSTIELNADPVTAFADLTPFPQLQSVPIGKLLQRAQLITRWSSLVVGILPLVNFRSSAMGSLATRSIRQLRSLIIPEHKLKFINKILDKIRAKAGSGNMPSFKVSRAKTLGGSTRFAADGSESIAVQIFKELKKAGAATRNALYSGRELWWKVEFYGEGVQDCGGAFRESVVDIADDLMSRRTPLFIPVSNHEGRGSLRDAYVPNPSCLNFELYEWVGRLCAAAILSEESLVLRFPPLVWKLLGGAEVAADDLEEVDQSFLKTIRMIDGAAGGGGGGGGGGGATSSLGLSRSGEDGTAAQVLSAEDVDYLCLDFSISRTDDVVVELVPGGLDVDLTFANSQEWAKLACEARLSEALPQIAAIRRGICAVIPAPVLRMWTAQELELQVCGSPVIPVAAVRSTARFQIDEGSSAVTYLFEALERLSDEERSLFLRFVTGRARLPVSIKICSGDGGPGALPRAATCFNQLFLPPYQSTEQALGKIRYAIHNTRTIDTDGTRRGETFEIAGDDDDDDGGGGG